jgi:hypothetical protein
MSSTMILRFRSTPIALLVMLALATFLAGCGTARVDWASRTGHYTYDQSVAEFGPPDKEATLTDGTRVCEWMTRRGNTGSYVGYHAGFGYGPYYPYRGYAPGYYHEHSIPDYWLRLTFGPDGRLSAWKKLTR